MEDFTKVNFQVLGSEETYGPHAISHVSWPSYVMLFYSFTHLFALKISRFKYARFYNVCMTDFCIYSLWQNVREAVGWIAVHHKQKKALEIFAREIAPAGTGMGMFE